MWNSIANAFTTVIEAYGLYKLFVITLVCWGGIGLLFGGIRILKIWQDFQSNMTEVQGEVVDFGRDNDGWIFPILKVVLPTTQKVAFVSGPKSDVVNLFLEEKHAVRLSAESPPRYFVPTLGRVLTIVFVCLIPGIFALIGCVAQVRSLLFIAMMVTSGLAIFATVGYRLDKIVEIISPKIELTQIKGSARDFDATLVPKKEILERQSGQMKAAYYVKGIAICFVVLAVVVAFFVLRSGQHFEGMGVLEKIAFGLIFAIGLLFPILLPVKSLAKITSGF
jgi:hypothetical protein